MAETRFGGTDDDWLRPPPDRTGYRRDVVAALLLFVGALVSVWLYSKVGLYEHSAPAWQCILWAAVLTLPLAARRRFPVSVMAVVGADFIIGQLLHVPEVLFANITFFLAFYTVGAWSRNRMRALLTRALAVGVMFCWLFAALILGGDGSGGISTAGAFSPYLAFGLIQVITNLLYFGAAFHFGESGFIAARQRADLAARTAELEAERERTAEQAVALDRMRIARDLHDVVAHHVSLMGVQAGAARLILRDESGPAQQSGTEQSGTEQSRSEQNKPEQSKTGQRGTEQRGTGQRATAATPATRASAALATIEESARTAVDELHRMLRTLRQDEPADSPDRSTSTRGVARLGELVAEAETAGRPTSLHVIGEPREIPGTIDVSAYRVVQEALTNVRKHAGAAARAEVRVRYLADALEVEVSDDGLGRAAVSPAGPGGLGQTGMRERVAAVGGRIEIGPRPRGGYRVRARFPLATDAVPSGATEGAR